jgi:hypothetical protein
MPKARSQKQQMAAGAVYAAKKGKIKVSRLKGASKSMYQSMSRENLKKMAKTSRKNKPVKKS